MKLVSNINSNVFSLSAVAIGFLLTDNATPAEQNSLGNWLMLIGQVLCTNAAQQQVINNRKNLSTSKNSHIVNDSTLNPSDEQINMIMRVVKAMNSEIDNLKK